MREELPATFKVVTVWLLVGAAVFVAFQWWQHQRQQASFHAEGGVVEIRRGDDGHYHWRGTVNGRTVDFLVDTGASGVAIPASLARELGLEPEGQARASTAGGNVVGSVVRIDLTLDGGVRGERLRAVALPGLAENPLLGMDVLGKLSWRQEGGVLRIDLRPGSATGR